jgi:hypothetical protein
MIYLSARLAWHDTGWNACTCRTLHLDAPCIIQEQTQDGRDDYRLSDLTIYFWKHSEIMSVFAYNKAESSTSLPRHFSRDGEHGRVDQVEIELLVRKYIFPEG